MLKSINLVSFLIVSYPLCYLIRAQDKVGDFVYYMHVPITNHQAVVIWIKSVEEGYCFTDEASAERFMYLFDNLEFEHVIEQNEQN